MSRATEGQKILKYVRDGRFRLLRHAEQRSREREVFVEQVVHCAMTCFHWEWQEDHQTHLYLGFFTAATNPGGFTAVFLDEVLVVTVFKRKLTKWEKHLAKSVKI